MQERLIYKKEAYLFKGRVHGMKKVCRKAFENNFARKQMSKQKQMSNILAIFMKRQNKTLFYSKRSLLSYTKQMLSVPFLNTQTTSALTPFIVFINTKDKSKHSF